MTDVNKLLESLSPEKRRLLELKLRQQKQQKKEFPLSYPQQRLWFLDQLEPGSTAYNLPAAVRMRGTLDRDALEKSIRQIVKRHDILRTSFYSKNGKPIQLVLPESAILMQEVDLQTSQQPEEEAWKWMRRDNEQAFNLEKGPLLRVALIKLAELDHILYLNMHHIISDGWSVGVFVKELSTLYKAGHQFENVLPKLEIQYSDFAQWQLKHLQGESRQIQLDFWKNVLTSHPPVLEFPTDFPRPSVKSYHGKSVHCTLTEVDLTRLHDIAAKARATSFMLYLSAFYTLLYRYTAQTDLCVGTPIANRNRSETQELIGFFVNTLVIRQKFDPRISFQNLLNAVRETALQAFAHQDLPFEMLVEELQPERDLSHTPMFQVMFVHQSAARALMTLPGLDLESIGVDSESSKFDITFNLNEQPNKLSLVVEYDTDLFRADTIFRLMQHYENLLKSIAQNPESDLASLNYLSAEEKQNLTKDWVGLHKTFPVKDCLHHIFEAQVKKFPDRVALSFEGKNLSYHQLNQRVNQLAHFLIRQGVLPDELIAVYAERSIELLIGLLAIQKAGAAYLPMDPVYPADRIAYMVQDGAAKMVLTQTSLKSNLDVDLPLFLLDADWGKVKDESIENPQVAVTSENLSYVIYTSGSTGKPKGTLITHKNVVRLFTATEDWFHFSEKDVWTLFHSYAFDFSVWEIWGALLHGGRLVIVPQLISRLPQDFYRLLVQEQVTVLNQTPSAFNQLIIADSQADQDQDKLSLRYVIFGGEALDLSSLRPWFELHGDQKPQMINMYGITETTVHVSYYQISQQDVIKARGSIIGKAIPDLNIFVLDEMLQPVPVGVIGEIHVSGDGLARGYLNLPEFTGQRFVLNPFSKNQGERLYRSGDLARWLTDGNLEYIGRIDSQIKIRGFRIELAEIETVILNYKKIRQALVLTDKDKFGNDQIIAFFVKTTNQDLPVSELRQYLSRQLPDYMIPTIFVPLETFPLTANGKIDRKALKIPEDLERSEQSTYIAPRYADEEIIGEIFADLLNMANISITDNFFEIGGHSLLATQVISRIKDQLGIELPLRDIFQAPTVEALAQAAQYARLDQNGITTIPLIPVPRNQKIPLSFAQQRLWFLDQLEPGSPFYNIPSAYKILGEFDVEILIKSLDAMVARHEILRTIFKADEGKAYQHILNDVRVEIPRTDLRALSQSERKQAVEKHILEEAQKPFDLSNAPLFRARILILATQEQILLLTMHHIISDAWSMRIFIKEMAYLYQTIQQKNTPSLPKLDLQYADFAHWQRQWLTGEVLEKQFAYWKTQLSSCKATLDLPIAKTRPAIQSYHGAHLSFEIDSELAVGLKKLSKEHSATLFMTTLAAFNVLLFRYSGQDDINVGSPIANRNKSAIENIIGFFVNTLVFRTDLSGNPSFSQLIRRVKETALGAFSHQDIPFEKLLEVVQSERSLGHSPLFQVMFMLQKVTQDAEPAADFNLEFLDVENKISQFDLTLTLFDKPSGLSAGFEYNTDIYDEKDIQGMIRHFKLIIKQVLQSPHLPISALQLMDSSEIKKITKDFNKTERPIPEGLYIHSLFEQQAKETPQALAVVAEGKSLTYQQLNARANQLARYLKRQGVISGNRVGICVNRSLDMIVGLLGIIKSGATYVPLDPNYPESRISFMIKDANLSFILTQQAISDALPKENVSLICLDQDWAQISKEKLTGLSQQRLSVEDAVYLIYTSGSTGKPKGVLVPHRSVVNHNIAVANAFDLTGKDNVLQFATINFDSAVEEIFPTLSRGGTLILRGPEVLISGSQLIEMIASEKITVIDLPTAYWHQIVQEMEELVLTIPPSLRLVILGGDKINAERFISWNKLAAKNIRLINTYGPTETTIISTLYEASTSDKQMQEARDLPIGKPIANTKAYILDQNLLPVPVGIPGELFTGGICLAHGYWNSAHLTAEKFIPDPFSEQPGARMYRTGDLVCFSEDGNIDFLGRIDQQVKIRGFRVEIGEIENLLLQHSSLTSAVVVPGLNPNGSKRLLAYYSTDSGTTINSELLRNFLSETLPDYMIPAVFIHLEKIPYTPSGKIDIQNLPVPDDISSGLQSKYQAPATENEKILAEIMQEVLGQKKIGIHDNFFELGGDSILSIQVIARANQKGLHVTPVQMFKNQTIAELAGVVSDSKTIEAEQGLVLGEIPLTPIQHWFFEQNFIKPQHWNQSLLFEVAKPLNPDILRIVTSALLEHHDVLRMSYVQDVSGVTQVGNPLPDPLPFVYFNARELKQDAIKPFVEQQAMALQQSLDLSKGPLFKLAYFDFGQLPGRILLIIHHLAVDGVSWRIILEDFQTAYQQAVQGHAISLPPKTTSFKEWAEKIFAYASGEKLASEIDFWLALSRKTGLGFNPEIPSGINTEDSVRGVSVALNTQDTKALLQDVPAVYNTQINDILLAALTSSFAQWSGKRSLLLNLEGHGREEILGDVDISRTVGWFTTLYPVYLEQGSAYEAGQIIKSIKEQLRQIPNKGIGYGLLRYLSKDTILQENFRSLDSAPITFNYLGQFDQALADTSVLSPASESKGLEHDPQELRSSLIDISAAISQGKLNISFSFSKNQFTPANIELFSQHYLKEIRKLINHCQSPQAGGHTASDFNLAKLDEKKLDKVMAQLNKKKKKQKKI